MALDNGTGSAALGAGTAALDSGVEPLPPATTTRWVIRRKAQVVFAVRAGQISLDDACQRYGLSVDEFQSWQQQIDRHGLKGLRVTRLQDYRPRRTTRTKPA
ncbi:MAG: DUF1153 domain-containing protein [Alphaproteobacteria bacterium]|nr:DUF1153 domain-containing protein [Alphaproteobacteria bacterium]TAD91576.1 MAG: DUF1153 domain-containing protein [Alphaproteobacteria bacterium]